MKILRINYMKIWLVSNILGNLNYQESFSRKIYFIIKAFQWRKRWSVQSEMACSGGVKSTQNINIPENFMLLALAHILNQFLWQLNLILWWEDTTETPNPSRDRGHCTGTVGLDLCTLTFLNISSCIFLPFVQYWWCWCGVMSLLISGSNSIISHTSYWSSFYNSKLKVSPQFLFWFVKISLYLSHN